MGKSPDKRRGIVVVGASAGGVEALQQLVGSLPPDLGATLFVVLHLPPRADSALPGILERAGPFVARHARDNEIFDTSVIYVAPPDCHLIVGEDRVRVVRGARENRHRPAIDPLFRSAARAHGHRVVGVILSGALDDGALGLQAVTSAGGIGIVQDPGEASYAEMPRSAIRADSPHRVLPLREIGPEVSRLVAGDPTETATGGLEEIEAEIRTEAQEDAVEAALWAAMRALEERAALSKRLALRMSDERLSGSRGLFETRAREAEHHARAIRDVLLSVNRTGLEEASR